MEQILFFLLRCIYLMLPAYFANMAPVIVKKINLFAFPIDFDIEFRNNPLLGKNKTFRGLVFGVLFSIIIAYFQSKLYAAGLFNNLVFFSYERWFFIGFIMGFGALVGDSIKSFFKRRINIKPGGKFIPFDQTDFVIGALAFMMPFYNITITILISCIVLSLVLHIIVNHVSFYLGIRREKW